MTTAHRPTWKAAVGQDNEGGWNAGGAVSHQKSILDAPAHTKLKVRQQHQLKYSTKDELIQQSLLAIQEATKEANKTKQTILHQQQLGRIDPKIEEQGQLRLLQQGNDTIDVARIKAKYDDSDAEVNDDDGDDDEQSDLDAPDDDEDSDDDDEDDSDDDDEDDEAMLQAELAKIRAEREEKKQQQEAKESAIEMQAAEQAAMIGNPLLNFQHQHPNSTSDTASVVSGMTNTTSATTTTNGRFKRRWNDDIVFRNQASKGTAQQQQQPQKRFINDTVRNDFHKRFLNKFIR